MSDIKKKLVQASIHKKSAIAIGHQIDIGNGEIYTYGDIVSLFQKSMRRGKKNLLNLAITVMYQVGFVEAIFKKLIVCAIEDFGLRGAKISETVLQVREKFRTIYSNKVSTVKSKLKMSEAYSKYPEGINIIIDLACWMCEFPKSRIVPMFSFYTLGRIARGEKNNNDETKAWNDIIAGSQKISDIARKYCSLREYYIVEVSKYSKLAVFSGILLTRYFPFRFQISTFSASNKSRKVYIEKFPEWVFDHHTKTGKNKFRALAKKTGGDAIDLGFKDAFKNSFIIDKEDLCMKEINAAWKQKGRDEYFYWNSNGGLGKTDRLIKFIKNNRNSNNNNNNNNNNSKVSKNSKRKRNSSAKEENKKQKVFNNNNNNNGSCPFQLNKYPQAQLPTRRNSLTFFKNGYWYKGPFAQSTLNNAKMEVEFDKYFKEIGFGCRNLEIVKEDTVYYIKGTDLTSGKYSTTPRFSNMYNCTFNVIIPDKDCQVVSLDTKKHLNKINDKIGQKVFDAFVLKWLFGVRDTAVRNIMIDLKKNIVYPVDCTSTNTIPKLCLSNPWKKYLNKFSLDIEKYKKWCKVASKYPLLLTNTDLKTNISTLSSSGKQVIC